MKGYWLLEMIFGDKTYRAIIHKANKQPLTNTQVNSAANAFKAKNAICMPLVSIRTLDLDIALLDITDVSEAD